MPLSRVLDLDKSGNYFQTTEVYLGPSMGRRRVFVGASREITVAGAFNVSPQDSLIFVNVNAIVDCLLPNVALWMQAQNEWPRGGFERALYIKDLWGTAAQFPIRVTPFAGQSIDKLTQQFQIVQNRQLLRLFPLNDLSGWFSG